MSICWVASRMSWTETIFYKKLCCLTMKLVETILGIFTRHIFAIFETNRLRFVEKIAKICRVKTPKWSKPISIVSNIISSREGFSEASSQSLSNRWLCWIFGVATYSLLFRNNVLNPIPHEFWNNVSTWVWAIMAPPEFRLYKLVNSQLSTQKSFSDKYFDI